MSQHSIRFQLSAAILALALCLAAHAQNLLHNPQFDGPERNLFVWNQNPDVQEGHVKKLPAEGPDGETALRITPETCYALKQSGLRLVPGEKYRMGAWVRTKNLKSDFWLCALVVYNYWWQADRKSPRFPENTDGKWVRIESDFTAPESANGTHTYAVYVSTATGQIDVASPYLLPLSEKARTDSRPAAIWEDSLKRLTPYYPVLSHVSSDTGEIRFYTSYPPNQRLTDYICRVRYNNDPPRDFPVDENGMATAMMGKLPEGPARLAVQLVHRDSQKTIFTNNYSLTAVKPTDVPARRLNNLVVEYSRQPLIPGKSAFIAPMAAWYRLAFTAPAANAEARLDGQLVIAQQPGLPADAAMRYLEPGTHTIDIAAVNGAQLSGELVVTRVPQLTYYPLIAANGNPSYFKPEARAQNPVISDSGMFDYDQEFCRQVIWPTFNSCIIQNDGKPRSPAEHALRKAMNQWGILATGCNGFPPDVWADGAKMTDAIRKCPHIRNTAGRCLDEIFADMTPEYNLALCETGWNLQDFDKTIHTWAGVGINGYFKNPAIHRHMLAAMTNISRGKGKILLETYAVTTPDNASMEHEMDQLAMHLKYLAQILPDAPRRAECIIGGYLLQKGYCTNCFPQSDPKVFYDRFFQTIATRPEYLDLAGIGCYCYAYCDEENARWIAAITRHYGIDGRTDLLSDSYGFKLNPGHLKNPDFLDGLAGWTAEPAEQNSIQATEYKGFGGKKFQNRITKLQKNCGDSCVQFIRSAKAPNRLSQIITGLTPGKLYSLSFTSANPDDLDNPTGIRRPYVLNATLNHADIIPQLGYEFNSLRPDRAKDKPAEIVIRKIVFRAKAPQATLTFSDWKDDRTPGAPAGQKRIMNFVAVNPYFTENGK